MLVLNENYQTYVGVVVEGTLSIWADIFDSLLFILNMHIQQYPVVSLPVINIPKLTPDHCREQELAEGLLLQ